MNRFFKNYRSMINQIAKAQGYKLKWFHIPQNGINGETIQFKIVKAPNLKRVK